MDYTAIYKVLQRKPFESRQIICRGPVLCWTLSSPIIISWLYFEAVLLHLAIDVSARQTKVLIGVG